MINIVGNKKDLATGKDTMSEHELEHLTKVGSHDQNINGFYLETSALSGLGVEELFSKTLGTLIKRHEAKAIKQQDQKLSAKLAREPSKLSQPSGDCKC